MLFTNNLNQLIFSQHNRVNCDELFIISGYVGPSPIQRLSQLPIKTTVIYGMYGSESISTKLHNTLIPLHKQSQNEILYSNIPLHSKCYIWRCKGEITYALIGSANFSTNGLTTPFRESLVQVANETFSDLNNYLDQVIHNSIPCNSSLVRTTTRTTTSLNNTSTIAINSLCTMVLYDPKRHTVPNGSGLNWGHSPNAHNKLGDAYIPIRTMHIRDFPTLFPAKKAYPSVNAKGRAHRQNDSVELIWDDGTVMDALLEGSQPVNGIQYPKQLSSFPSKNTLGVYMRKRLGLSPIALVTKADLDRYGRDNITISLLQNGTYFVDFSV
ncbi:restriction endonuclease PLD domain-containing protein [Bacillus wiedmannii]|uniref:restriction endonuclease PLD domain-containing protein n=1 Tax=Bacillus wiedmannii TaxID=1890302 RepID=UPI003D21A480